MLSYHTMILHMPSEVLLHVCDYLGMDSIARLAAASRSLREVVSKYDVFSSSRIDSKDTKINDDTLRHGVLAHVASNASFVDVSNSNVTHVSVYHIMIKYTLVRCIRITGSPVNETELARKLIIYCRKHPLMRPLTLELGRPKKSLSDNFVKTLKKAYPALTLKRWFCPSRLLDIAKFHRSSINDPDNMPCHECFEITPRAKCDACSMTTCPRCMNDIYCIGCSNHKHGSNLSFN